MSATFEPKSPDDIARVIKESAGKGTVVVRESDRSDDSTVQLCLSRLNKIIDYPFDDMTITIQAGMTCAQLATHLAEHDQQLPIDVSSPNMTIGQLVAGNRFGPRIAGYGTVRDYLIGIQGIDGAGRIFRSGGRVVKNVAGYDLCRLLIGSRGRLGVVTECTFKLKPKPAATAAIRLNFDSKQQLNSDLKALNQTIARPIIVDIHGNPSTEHHSTLIVAVEGSTESCAWQLRQIERECTSTSVGRLDQMAIENYLASPDRFRQRENLQIKTLRSSVPAITDQLLQLGSRVSGHAADGILNCDDSSDIRTNIHKSFPAELAQFVDHAPSFAMEEHPMNQPILATFDPHSVFAGKPIDE